MFSRAGSLEFVSLKLADPSSLEDRKLYLLNCSYLLLDQSFSQLKSHK